MEQYLLGMLPPEEFFARTVVRAEGNKDLLDDKEGFSINYTDISLTDFLANK